MRMRAGPFSVVVPCLFVLSCGPSYMPYVAPSSGGNGAGDSPAEDPPPRDPDPVSGKPDGGFPAETDDAGECGGMEFAVTWVAPNVMMVIDRSGSMGEAISATSSTSKWQDLLSAISPVLTTYDGQIRFGLDLFGDGDDDDSCAPGPIVVPLGDNHGPLLQSALAATMPHPATPTAATLDIVIQNGMLNDSARDNVVVLATDGMPNCNSTVADVTARIQTLYGGSPSVKTYVIGVGSATASNPSALNSWATAGHTAKAGSTKYYQSNSAMDLKVAFDSIVGGLVSCTFKLAQAAPDPTQLYVWSGGASVAASMVSGYSYDAAGPSITLHGAPCDQLQSTPTIKIQVVYGCPNRPADPG